MSKSVLKEEIHVIYDTENDPVERRKFINERLEKHHPNTYLSQSCFEVFLLLHFKASSVFFNQSISPNQRFQELVKILPNYKKGGDLTFLNKDIIEETLKREMAFRDYSQSTFCDVGLFVEFLLSLSN